MFDLWGGLVPMEGSVAYPHATLKPVLLARSFCAARVGWHPAFRPGVQPMHGRSYRGHLWLAPTVFSNSSAPFHMRPARLSQSMQRYETAIIDPGEELCAHHESHKESPVCCSLHAGEHKHCFVE
jgi:hypothetical protein